MDWLQALGPSILIIIGGVISWFLKARTDDLQAVQQALRSDQRGVYKSILEPYIKIFAGLKQGKGQDDAIKQIQSFDYRKAAFELALIGSDGVVDAYNNLMQHTFALGDSPGASEGGIELMRLWGALLLEIRKSLGHKDTGLTERDMLRGMITDIDRLFPTGRGHSK